MKFEKRLRNKKEHTIKLHNKKHDEFCVVSGFVDRSKIELLASIIFILSPLFSLKNIFYALYKKGMTGHCIFSDKQ